MNISRLYTSKSEQMQEMFKLPKLHLTRSQSAFKINKTVEIVLLNYWSAQVKEV